MKQSLIFLCLITVCISCGHKPEIIKGEQTSPSFSTSSANTNQTDSTSSPQADSLRIDSTFAGQVAISLPEDIQFGVALYNSGQYEKAQDILEKAIAAGSVDWRSFYFLGLCCKELKEYQHAKSSLQNALAFAPNIALLRSELYSTLAGISESAGNAQQALLQYHMAVNLNPENGVAKNGVDRLSPHTSK